MRQPAYPISELRERTDYDFYRQYDRIVWSMENCERLAMMALLGWLKPACSIEIGTREGGSLAVIAANSGKVFTLDMDPDCQKAAQPFPNAEFIVGSSQEKLPGVLRTIEEQHLSLEFVLVDGDHSEDGVRGDIECLLKYKPKRPCYILMHDSFNPFCREGMASAPWEQCPYVNRVDFDFVPGKLHPPGDTHYSHPVSDEMWGGLGLAVLRPEERVGPLEIFAGSGYLHTLALRHSAHRPVLLAKHWFGPRHYQGLKRALGPRRMGQIKRLLVGRR
jgi:hypothetical protein